jgi:(heptosyl)LPS beta-1,4-glucosyltransferase
MDDRLPISVLLLARDEVELLAALLPGLGFARDIVVVRDPRGDPAVADLARSHGARVFERAFDGFGPQRKFALAQCVEPWVLWLDADERLGDGSLPALRRALALGAGPIGVALIRRTWFLGRRMRWSGWRGERIVRLFTRAGASFDDAPVHERLRIEGGTIVPAPGALEIEHFSYRTWEDCVHKLVAYAAANADKAWREGRRAGPFDLVWRPPLRFARQYVLQLGMLDGAHGLALCGLAAAQVFLKYAGLWERTRRARAASGAGGGH